MTVNMSNRPCGCDATEALYSQETAEYLSTADRRIVSGFRFALELQGLTIPTAAIVRPSGPRRRVDVLRDFHADNPAQAELDHQRDLETNWKASKADRNARTNTMIDTAIRPSADVIATIEALHRDLDKVRAVESILGDAAADKIKSLQADIAAANSDLSEALAEEAEQARRKLLACFSDISVAVSYPAGRDGMLLSAGFLITYERLTYNMAERANLPKQYTCNGFAALPDEAYAYLVEVKPEAIPAEIMALAPGDPREAFSRYFMAKGRGYLVG